MEKVNKFIEQLSREIESLEDDIKFHQKKLKEGMESRPYEILQFGLAKDAEKLTVTYAKLQALYDQRDAFQSIFSEELEA